MTLTGDLQAGPDAGPRDRAAAPWAGSLERVDLAEVPYADANEQMRGWVTERQAGQAGDRLFLLSHPPVITYGHRTDPADLRLGQHDIPVLPVDRGGYATYHGPGQLVGYLVLDLRERGPADVVRWLEAGLVRALGELGFAAQRRDTPPGASSLVGVWTPDERKVASIGMRIRHGVTSHGFALNVDPDLWAFDQFTVCGLPGVRMTSLRELAVELAVAAPADPAVRDAVYRALSIAHADGG
ncbi:MAG TPA: lipoyl(octanoyl) transferase LipB [Streptosporangiaceae bacterium]|nr:lipoyl(octanoyl) transferase LipB [Streptosporangiaceae bacterium]